MRKIFEKLNHSDLLEASTVSKFWRNVAEPFIANSSIVEIRGNYGETVKLGQFTIGYKHVLIEVSQVFITNII